MSSNTLTKNDLIALINKKHKRWDSYTSFWNDGESVVLDGVFTKTDIEIILAEFKEIQAHGN